MRKYTIAGTTYYASGGRLFVTRDEEHGVEDVDDHAYHLYASDDYEDADPALCRLEWGGSIHSTVEVSSLDGDGPPDHHVWVDEFTGATPVDSVIPDGIHECPGCGSWAGSKDDKPRCYECGHGIETEGGQA